MTPRERLAAAARTLTPLQQGDLDSLCGLYAVINAVQLVLYPDRRLRRPDLVELYEAGLDVLRKSRSLQTVMLHGMHEPTWAKVSAAVVTQASRVTGDRLELMPLVLPPRADDRDAILLIRRHVRAGWPVLLAVNGRLDHWTVVARFSKTRLLLFDSAGHRWVLIRSIGVSRDVGDAPYGIRRRGLVALCRPDGKRS